MMKWHENGLRKMKQLLPLIKKEIKCLTIQNRLVSEDKHKVKLDKKG